MNKNLLSLSLIIPLMIGCQDNENNSDSGAPISFDVSMESFKDVLGSAPSTVSLKSGDTVGVYVYATKQMPFKVETDGNNSKLIALSADIPQSYGQVSYACIPANGSEFGFLKMGINIPANQTYVNGRNPNLINSVAYSAVSNGVSSFNFKQYGAVFALGLSSDEEITLSKMTVEAKSPDSGAYLTGTKSLTFKSMSEFTVDDKVSNGSNTITIDFPEGLKLSSNANYVTFATLPFSTSASGLKVVLYDAKNHTCSLAPILTQSSALGENGALSVQAGDYVACDLGKIKKDDFDIPAIVNISLKDKITGKPLADHEVYLYSLVGTTETLVATLKTDALGKISKEINPGTYKLGTKYNDNFGPQWNTTQFTAKMDETLDVELDAVPIIFADDFNWITPEMGGSAKVLKPYYVSYNPPAFNSAAADEVMFAESTSDAQAKLAEIGYEWVAPDYTYLRPGVLKFGKKNSTGDVTTPKFGKYYSDVPSNVVMYVTAISWNGSSDKISWTYEKSQLIFTIIGEGSFSESSSETTYTTPLLNAGTPPDMYTYIELPIYGASANTQVKFGSVKQSTGTQWRCMVDDIKITPLVK